MKREMKIKEAFHIVLKTTSGKVYETYEKKTEAVAVVKGFLERLGYGAILLPMKKEPRGMSAPLKLSDGMRYWPTREK